MVNKEEYALVRCPKKRELGYHTAWVNPKVCLNCENARKLVNKTKQAETILKCKKKLLGEPILVKA